jgi:hypothetical protein
LCEKKRRRKKKKKTRRRRRKMLLRNSRWYMFVGLPPSMAEGNGP